jgi:D,D-heptose 1,7-bisphosphate phosphatase
MKVVMMAGGKGTRIASVNSEVPKPMIRIMGKPILEYEIESLKLQGYTDLILVVGHLGSVITDYFGDGSRFGVSIEYVVEEKPLGTAGALYLLKHKLKGDFLLLNGDIIFDINIDRFYRYHKERGGVATLFTHPNNHPYDSGIIITDNTGRVQNWLHKEDERLWYRNRVNAGIHMLSSRIFEDTSGIGLFQELKKIDLDRDVLKPLLTTGQLYVYDSPEYVKDMGTPDRLYAIIEDIKSGKVQAKNLSRKQKAVFLDRDGTINKYVGFLRHIDDFELQPGVAEAIRIINASGYLAIVVTNQPVIARGEVTYKQLREIHNKMETLLGQEGAYIDAIYFCPHHPHKGYEGEISELKLDCDCRKPKPGMLLKAAEDFNIDLSQSWMIGDGESDAKAGNAVGCHTALVGGQVEIADVERYAGLIDFSKEKFGQQ